MNLFVIRWIDMGIGIPLVLLFKLFRLLTSWTHHSAKGDSYKKILLVKFWGIGNIVMILPAARDIKRTYPGAKVDFLTLSGNRIPAASSGLFSNIITIDTKNGFTFIVTTIKALKALAGSGYDLVIDFEQFARFSALICSMVSRAGSIGFNTDNQMRHFLYTTPVLYNNNIHMTQSFHSLVEAAGVPKAERIEPVSLNVPPEKAERVKTIIKERGISDRDVVAIFHIGTSENFPERRWPPEFYASLGDKFVKEFGVKIVFTGLNDEKGVVRTAYAAMKEKGSAIDMCGALSFDEYCELIKRSDLVFSADTATVHIASALGRPTVGFYGPNTPLLYGPWGKDSIYFYKGLTCSPCITNYNAKMNKCRNVEGRGVCMRKISPEEVFAEVKAAYFDATARCRIERLLKR